MFQGRCDDGSLNHGIVITSGNRLDERCLRALVTSALVFWCGYTCARPAGPMVPRAHSYHWGCSTAGRSDIPVPKPTKQDLQPPARNNNMALSTTWSLPSNAIHVCQVKHTRHDWPTTQMFPRGSLCGSPSDCSPHRLAKLRTRPHPSGTMTGS